MTVSLSLIHQHFLIYTIIPKTRETEFLRMCFRILKTDCGFQHRYILNFSKNTRFEKLEILEFIDGEVESFVTFKATLFQDKNDISFIEKSRFLKTEGIWKYVDGQFID